MDIHLTRFDSKTTVASSKSKPAEKASVTENQARPAGGSAGETSLKLTALTASLETVPPVDDAKVKQVSNALQSGNYQVHVQRLADKILNFESGLP
ncbi:flagellar biosynthesis anti-sigma factor FlgM [Methylococcus sp. EFPC2]|uniref:flagellar biosynthesis anti-sigma factor FlgM n=1 Tax=Methylococcus sp. EFPC2 TaxID=2812648 RepID=UPI0019676DE2|nr:flagellar biosynthesis anti-sigma factor FlgM [Methylococcus sp. EFPC2]QSA98377.1 flagellar biosynthesis anti-sigma factor FlgM [Methylococcus sp. EFPC2]